MQHPMDTSTGTCVSMVSLSATGRLYDLGNAESIACGSSLPSQVPFTPARPSQAPRTIHDLTNEISTAGGPPSPDEEGNSIAPGTRALLGYFPRAFDEWSEFEEPPFIPCWDESDSDSDHRHRRNITVVSFAPKELPPAQKHLGVRSTVGKTQRLASKSPETKLAPSEVFNPNGGLKKAPCPSFLDELERKDIGMAMTGLEQQVTARHEHLHHLHSEQEPVQSDEAVPAQNSAQLLEQPSTSHSGVDSSSPAQNQSQPLATAFVEPPSSGSAEAPREDNPNPVEHAFDPSTSSVSLATSDNTSDNTSVVRPRNSARPRKGIPTKEEKSRPVYQSRKYACPHPESECGARFHRSDNRDRHIKSVHEGRLDWECPVRGCGKGCKRWDNGIQHLQMEHDSTCRECDIQFDHAKDLYDHLRNNSCS